MYFTRTPQQDHNLLLREIFLMISDFLDLEHNTVFAGVCIAWNSATLSKRRDGFGFASLKPSAFAVSEKLLTWAFARGCPRTDSICAKLVTDKRYELLGWAHLQGCPWGKATYTAAASIGDLELLKKFGNGNIKYKKEICCAAVFGNHTHVLEFMFDNINFDIDWASDEDIELRTTPALTLQAAKGGNLETLRWLVEDYDFPLGVMDCRGAADNNYMHIVKWLHKNQCPWDCGTTAGLIRNGNLAGLQWIHERECPWAPNGYTIAAIKGYLDILKWAHANDLEGFSKIVVITAAVKGGHPDILRWVDGLEGEIKWTHKPHWSSGLCGTATKNGDLTTLGWLREQGCVWGKNVCSKAAINGDLAALKWLRTNGCPWGELVCYHAAANRHYLLLKWAHRSGCSWDDLTATAIAFNDHINVLKWAHENKCPFTHETFSITKNPQINAWLLSIQIN